jgi:anti-sigma factor RsiW
MKETWERKMQENVETCARAEDLVAYLYGEASQQEAKDFEMHIERCAACRKETAAFGDVRRAIGDWRQQALGALLSPASETNEVTAYASPREIVRPRRSAFAALREFFTLSPVWMRAATAAIALVFCALVVIAIAHFREQSKTVIAEKPKTTSVVPQQKQENKQEVAVKETPDETNVNPKDQQIAPPQSPTVASKQSQMPGQIRHGKSGIQQSAKNKRQQLVPRNDDNALEELASANDDLPFTAPSHEVKLPSLIDLVDEPE